MIRRLHIFALAFFLLFAQQGAVLHVISHIGENTPKQYRLTTSHDASRDTSDDHDEDGLCLQCLAFSALAGVIHVTWPCLCAASQNFLYLSVHFTSVIQRALQVYVARAPPFYS